MRRAVLTTPEAIRSLEHALRASTLPPVDQYVFMSYATRRDGLFDGTYDLWRVKRIEKLLAIYGLDGLAGKRVLELGAGHGDIGALLASLGAEVTCAEGRVENLNFGRLKHRKTTGLSFVQQDLEKDFRSLGTFDVVINFGLLYHIVDVEEHLSRCLEMSDELVLESVVCDSTDPNEVILVDENSSVNEEALGDQGSRPSPFFIERVAHERGFQVDRHFTPDLNAGEYIYDWEHSGDTALGFERRRFWRIHRGALASDVG